MVARDEDVTGVGVDLASLRNRKLVTAGLRDVADGVALGLALPLRLLGVAALGLRSLPTVSRLLGIGGSDERPQGSRWPPVTPRSVAVEPFIAAAEIFMRGLETIAMALGGRARSADFKGPPPDPVADTRLEWLMRPLVTMLYRLCDLGETYKKGVEITARRLRRRR